MKTIDLHTHSKCSDGSFTPSELMRLAHKSGLAAIALTDHDTMVGIKEARAAAAECGIEFVPGVELSCAYKGHDIHIVGLFIDEDDPVITQKLEEIRIDRQTRNSRMIEKMQAYGVNISEEMMRERCGKGVVTRAHFAQVLIEQGFATDVKDAFDRFIGDGELFYVPKIYFSPEDAIKCILNAGGIPILAHPLRYGMAGAELETMVKLFVSYDLKGIEVYYSANTGFDEIYMKELADRYGLLYSGGSDFHGDKKPDIKLGTGRGSLVVPYSVLLKLREQL